MMHFFGEKEVQDVEVIAIQESMINRSTTQMTIYVQTLQDKFHVAIRPTSSHVEADKPRVCFFINKNLKPKQWSVQHHSLFYQAILSRMKRTGSNSWPGRYTHGETLGQPLPQHYGPPMKR
jgi:hypothetical protein